MARDGGLRAGACSEPRLTRCPLPAGIWAAARDGDEPRVRQLLDRRGEPGQTDLAGYTALVRGGEHGRGARRYEHPDRRAHRRAARSTTPAATGTWGCAGCCCSAEPAATPARPAGPPRCTAPASADTSLSPGSCWPTALTPLLPMGTAAPACTRWGDGAGAGGGVPCGVTHTVSPAGGRARPPGAVCAAPAAQPEAGRHRRCQRMAAAGRGPPGGAGPAGYLSGDTGAAAGLLSMDKQRLRHPTLRPCLCPCAGLTPRGCPAPLSAVPPRPSAAPHGGKAATTSSVP